jgi:serine/threonine protein kinase
VFFVAVATIIMLEVLSLPDELSSWEKIKRLGGGGQGDVYLVRTPLRVEGRMAAFNQIRPSISNIGGFENKPSAEFVKTLLRLIEEWNRPDAVSELGALKEFKIAFDNPEEAERAIGRLRSEVAALQKVKHPAVLRLLAANVDQRFIVTEFHPGGALANNLHRCKGRLLEALNAFRELVDGVRAIHETGDIHRDIKPENIFIAHAGGLVLGDFGIVFLAEGGRLTSTVERVGSHYWMAPLAYRDQRLNLDEINFKLDIYPLAKVLWSMIAGRNGFLREEFKEDDNDIEKLFPDDPNMRLVNGLLTKCAARREQNCQLSTAAELLSEVDGLIEKVKAAERYREVGAQTWPCRICGKGVYRDLMGANYIVKAFRRGGPAAEQEIELHIYICDHCRHGELFRATS